MKLKDILGSEREELDQSLSVRRSHFKEAISASNISWKNGRMDCKSLWRS